MSVDLDRLVAALRPEERAALTAGADMWTTVPIERLGIPALRMSDGPIGARGATADHQSLTPSVAVPCGAALGASWDPALVAEASAIVARQALEKGARVLLAPTVNLQRHPLWGRNFEAFSEDPLLSGVLASAYIEGVQDEGVAATVKHLVCNETEFERYTSSSDLDERTLRELYLLPFEFAVRRAGVLALMTSYNRVNGRHVPDQARLVTEILRGEWGFDGVVMTDWWAMTITEEAGETGLDLEMPGPARSFGPALAGAVEAGRVDERHVAEKARHVLGLLGRLGLLDGAAGEPAAGATAEEHPQDRPEDRAALRRAAADSLVLLRNDGVLPLELAAPAGVALIGPRALHPPILGGGSAKVRPHYRLSLLEALRAAVGAGVEVEHEEGAGEAGIERAVALAGRSDAAVVVVGTDEVIESEGHDRISMALPAGQDELVERVCRANGRTVVVVTSGAPIALDSATGAAAVIQSFFGGQEVAHALADVITGRSEPGGRLPVTLPLRLEDTPAYGNFPGESSHVRYSEGLLVGYRWYEARRLAVAYPFGHGLSYTSFELGAPSCSTDRLEQGDALRVELTVRNTGQRAGSEVVQCYVAPPGETGRPGGRLRAPKELRAFAKVRLEAGESTGVVLELGPRAFAYYDVADTEWPELVARRPPTGDQGEQALHRSRPGWYVEGGRYALLIGRSSADIAHRLEVDVAGGDEPLDAATLPG